MNGPLNRPLPRMACLCALECPAPHVGTGVTASGAAGAYGYMAASALLQTEYGVVRYMAWGLGNGATGCPGREEGVRAGGRLGGGDCVQGLRCMSAGESLRGWSSLSARGHRPARGALEPWPQPAGATHDVTSTLRTV